MFSINQPLFLQKTNPLNPHHKYLFGIGMELELELEFGLQRIGNLAILCL